MWRAITFKSVLSLKLKMFARKSISLEKLANGRMFFKFNQPELWLLTAEVKEYNPYVFLLIFMLNFMANDKATTRQSTTFVRYLMTFLISDVW